MNQNTQSRSFDGWRWVILLYPLGKVVAFKRAYVYRACHERAGARLPLADLESKREVNPT